MGAFLSRVFAALLGRGCRQPGPFSYAGPLDSKSIRLLQLRRPKWYWYAFRVTKPALSMGTYRTDSLPKYVALSYTWGPPQQDAFGYGSNDKVPFLINGRIFPLFRNLGNALGSLHRAWDFDDDVQHLWVDAICINQHDEAERASQVSIMDRIYRGAASTCVWLGEESRSQTRAPIFRNILNTPSEDFVPYYHQYPSGTPPADGFWQSKGLPCPDDEEQWAPVRRLFQNQWFSRAWIIQEVLLSRNIYVCWGSTWMTWDDLGKMALVGHVAKLGQHSALPLLFQHLSGEGTHSEPQDWAVHDPVTIALQLWLNGHRYSQQTPLAGKVMQGLVDEMQALCGSAVVTPTSWLMYFCLTNRWADATEPQDKVFAFLGLANNLTEPGTEPCPIIPTYSPEVTHLHIYEQCMRRLIEETDSLDVFMAINDPPAARDPLLPSWVPDLSRRQGLDLMWSIRPRFRAHGGDSSLVPGSSVSSERESESKTPAASRRLQIEGPCLLARGTLIATITRRGPSSIDLLGPNWYCWFSQLLELDPVYSLTGESRVEAFWRTLLMNSVAKRHPAEWPESTDVPGRADTEKQLHPFRAHVLQVLARSYPGPDPEADRDGHESYQREMASLTKLSEEDFSGHMPSFRGRGDLISQFTDTPVDEAEALSHEAVLAALTACMERASAFLIGMDASMVNRVVAFSSGCHIVNAPMWTEEGDGIFILDSCPCPLVLRPQPGQAGCYTLVGPAYVHGIMYGEAVNEETQWAEVCIQ